MELTEYDQQIIAQAREVAALNGETVCEWTDCKDIGLAYASAFGAATVRIDDLLRLIDHLAGVVDEIDALVGLLLNVSAACGVPPERLPQRRPTLRAVSLRRTRAPATAPQGPP